MTGQNKIPEVLLRTDGLSCAFNAKERAKKTGKPGSQKRGQSRDALYRPSPARQDFMDIHHRPGQ